MSPRKTVDTANRPPFWVVYDVTWEFVSPLCGSVPTDKEAILNSLTARAPRVKPPNARSIEEVHEEVYASVEGTEDTEVSKHAFQRDPITSNLVMRAATIKAHLKDCARILGPTWVGKIEGEYAFSTRVLNCVYPDELTYWVPILRLDSSQIYKPDGEEVKPIHIRHPRTGAQMSAIKVYEWVLPARLDFRLKVLGNAVVQSDLAHLMRYGGTHGYAGERSDGQGRYITRKLKEVAGDE